ncbi:MAG: sodium-dependent transporter [Lachnospiraceae bacterium]|nr:sodium-dependent transporter [Lachnospiraceae bacterium]
MENQVKRETLGSRLGFILLSAGCAIGIGNVWKFPWMVGQYGGGAFVLIYLICLIILGVPVMTMEFSLGRASRKSVVKMYQELEKPKHKWHIHGYFAMAGNYILMMFYTVVTGWMLQYFVDMAAGKFVGADATRINGIFDEMLANPTRLTIYMVVVVLIGIGVCSIGVQKGVERITKVMMIALIVIMVILAANSIFLDGGSEGLKFYLIPNFDTMKKIGVVDVIVAAMNQAFFTLSLGMGCMAIFGSYVKKDRSLMGESVNVAVLDTFVAFTSGLIIFPACFAYGVEVDNGKSLIFKTLPNIFNNIPLGRLWGSLFFVFMSFAALSTIITVFETVISCTMDLWNWSRKKACLINGIALLVLSMPCVLGFNILRGFRPFGNGSNVMDLEDFAVNNILLPVGSLIFVIFCTTRYGWGWDKFTKEANEGKGLKVAKWMKGYMTFVLPVIILAIFVLGLISYFS